jgi:shikimate kinase
MKPIILIGYMGSGKTAVGKKLAQKLNIEFFDTDLIIVETEKMKVADIFNCKGEEYFRSIETKTLIDLKDKIAVIASGGGVILKEENRRVINANYISVFLKCEIETIINRISNDNTRPLFNKENINEFITRYEQRLPMYKQCKIEINVDNKKIDNICDEIIDSLKTII